MALGSVKSWGSGRNPTCLRGVALRDRCGPHGSQMGESRQEWTGELGPGGKAGVSLPDPRSHPSGQGFLRAAWQGSQVTFRLSSPAPGARSAGTWVSASERCLFSRQTPLREASLPSARLRHMPTCPQGGCRAAEPCCSVCSPCTQRPGAT